MEIRAFWDLSRITVLKTVYCMQDYVIVADIVMETTQNIPYGKY